MPYLIENFITMGQWSETPCKEEGSKDWGCPCRSICCFDGRKTWMLSLKMFIVPFEIAFFKTKNVLRKKEVIFSFDY